MKNISAWCDTMQYNSGIYDHTHKNDCCHPIIQNNSDSCDPIQNDNDLCDPAQNDNGTCVDI
jgi:hypothetical protein